MSNNITLKDDFAKEFVEDMDTYCPNAYLKALMALAPRQPSTDDITPCVQPAHTDSSTLPPFYDGQFSGTPDSHKRLAKTLQAKLG